MGDFHTFLATCGFYGFFGDNVEGILGHIKFGIFYLLCGLVATMSQLFVNPESTIPMVGASGAIASVLGMYMIRFPHAKSSRFCIHNYFYNI